MGIEDEDLLVRLRAGEERAYRELVRTYHGAMRSVARAIAGTRFADEVVQDAWLAVVQNLGSFQQRSSIKTWLLTITANAARTRLRRDKGEVSLEDLAGPHGTIGADRFSADGHWRTTVSQWHDETPEAMLIAQELRDCLDRTVQSLSELQASVLMLRELQGLELEEICNVLDISLSNVRVLLHRARLKVYATLEHFEETGKC